MNVLIYLVPIALGLGLTGLAGFLWSLRAGQYDDLEGASLRILSNDDLRDAAPVPGRSDASPHGRTSTLTSPR